MAGAIQTWHHNVGFQTSFSASPKSVVPITTKVMAKAGDTVSIGTVIAFIIAPGEKLPEIPVNMQLEKSKEKKDVVPIVSTETSKKIEGTEEPFAKRASGIARRIAKERNVDLSQVSGTGPDGRINKEDVLRFIEGVKVIAPVPCEIAATTEGEVASLSDMRKPIARRMVESFPALYLYLTVDVDVQKLQQVCQQLLPVIENEAGIPLTLIDLIIKIVAKALEENPAINCSFTDGSVKLFKYVDIGLVTSVKGDLMVPVIRDVNTKSLAKITQTRAEVVQKAKDLTLTKEEMTGSTFTIYDMGMYDIDKFSAVIRPQEAAILAMGRITKKVVVQNDEIAIRPVMSLTLSIDYRVLDGALGAQFLQTTKNYIENPLNLIL